MSSAFALARVVSAHHRGDSYNLFIQPIARNISLFWLSDDKSSSKDNCLHMFITVIYISF